MLRRMAILLSSGRAPACCRPWAVCAILALTTSAACRTAEAPQPADLPRQHDAQAIDSHELGLLMAMQQNAYLLHKLTLSIEARNPALAAFYAGELEEVLEEVSTNLPTYEGHDIAGLTRTMVLPAIGGLRGQVEGGNWAEASAGIEAVTAGCNQCHLATDHGFIVVTSGVGHNPFNQQFEP